MSRRQSQVFRASFSPLLCVALLLGIVAEARTRIQPQDAAPFHARAAAAIASIPSRLDSSLWTGQDIPIPTPAVELLHPNARLSADYTELQGDQLVQGQVLLIQCKDAVDMQGHYPPHCYPANGGSQLLPAHRRTWTVGNLVIPGTEYFFARPAGPIDVRQWIYNFFIIPRIPGLKSSMVGIYPDIEAVYQSGGSYQRHYFGAAQFQFIFNENVPQQERDRFMIDFLTPNLPVIYTLLNDPASPSSPAAAAPASSGAVPSLLNSGGINP
ncbi:MAG TPA: hypothetical protein VMD30_04455 [Tepidisphaeraceae bacterium]|nr:hypothetical protein [Tepidisphaeraceae bacterium]